MRILWVTQRAAMQGGCESYIHNTVTALSAHGVENGILYNINHPFETNFVRIFDAVLPAITPQHQIRHWRPDIIYVHQLDDERLLDELLACGLPVIRFYHDHRLFCLREHKYKAFSQATCTDTVGLNCYSCLGFLNRSGASRHWQLRSLGSLHRDLERNRQLHGHVVASDYLQQHLVDHAFQADRILVNPLYGNAVALRELPTRSKHRLVYAGQLVNGKGVDVLIRALPAVDPSLTLDIYGTGAQQAELQGLVHKLKQEHRVWFHGNVSQSALQYAFAGAMCVIIPSRSPETFCLTGLEAFAVGTPVIASAVGGIPQWLRHLENGLLVASNDVAALADAITVMYRNPGARDGMSVRALDTATRLFTRDQHVRRLLTFFRSLQNRKVAA